MSSDNFYQRKKPQERRRRNQAVILDAAKQPVRPAVTPDTKPSELARKSLKMFAMIVASMMALMYVSVKLLEHLWSRRDLQLARQAAVVESPAPENSAALSPVTPVPERPVSTAGSTIDVEVAVAPVSGPDVRAASRADAASLFRWGKVLEQAGELTGALMLYQQAIEAEPANPETLAQAGRLFIRLSRYAEAVPLLQRAHVLVPDEPDVMNDLGVALTFNADAAGAVALYDRLFVNHPEYTPALFNQGYALVQQRAWVKARPLLETYLTREPSNAMAMGVLAMLEVAETNTTRALELLDQAIQTKPSWATPYLDAAAICASISEPDRAVSYLERALAVADPAEVFRQYSMPAFREIRNTTTGMDLEKKIADRARQTLAAPGAP